MILIIKGNSYALTDDFNQESELKKYLFAIYAPEQPVLICDSFYTVIDDTCKLQDIFTKK